MIPEKYKQKGFTRVGQEKESTRVSKKWMVLAKKGDRYKVVHGGDNSMKDFSQHKDKQRQKNFWNRMGKTNDVFSPRYWHSRLNKWYRGGQLNEFEMLKKGGYNMNQNGNPMYKRKDGKVVKRGIWSNIYLSKKEGGGPISYEEWLTENGYSIEEGNISSIRNKYDIYVEQLNISDIEKPFDPTEKYNSLMSRMSPNVKIPDLNFDFVKKQRGYSENGAIFNNLLSRGFRSLSEKHVRNNQDQYINNNLYDPYNINSPIKGMNKTTTRGYSDFYRTMKKGGFIKKYEEGGEYDELDNELDKELDFELDNALIDNVISDKKDESNLLITEKDIEDVEIRRRQKRFDSNNNLISSILSTNNYNKKNFLQDVKGLVNNTSVNDKNYESNNRKVPSYLLKDNDHQNKKQILSNIAQEEGVPPDILYGVWGAETTFGKAPDTFKDNESGARGHFQFLKGTAKSFKLSDRNNFEESARAAAKYLKQMQKRFGNYDDAIQGYNGGPTRVSDHLKNGRPLSTETTNYLPRVKNYASQFKMGGQYDLSEQQINELIKKGYKIERL